MAQKAMVIDLHRCTGCGACGLACKTENNTREGSVNESFKWADFYIKTVGEFPNTKFMAVPVLCNHCSDAPCVEACPVTPKAMYKTADGVTMHNDQRCIGCQQCTHACPYSTRLLANSEYSVISYNPQHFSSQPFYSNTDAIIPGCTASPSEVAWEADAIPPDRNNYSHPDYGDVRPKGVTEKCIFCEHRTKQGLEPYCVVSCPARARIFGDIDDPASEVSQLLKQYKYKRFKNNKGDLLQDNEDGTRPNVYYIRDFGPSNALDIPEIVKTDSVFKLYPNPASTEATIELNLETSAIVSVKIYSVQGALILTPADNLKVNSGIERIRLDCTGLKSGTYLCMIAAGDYKETLKLIVTH